MPTENRRIIEVEAKGQKSLADLAERLRDARASLAALSEGYEQGTVSEQEYQDGLVKVKKAQSDYNAEMRISVKEVSAAKGSYNDLVNQLSRLKEQWKNATPGSEQYKDLTRQINVVKDQLSQQDHEIGNWQRNVGNYANSILTAFISMGKGSKTAAAGAGVLNNGLKVLAANPVILMLMGLVKVLDGIGKGFSSNEAAANRLAVAFAPLKAGGQALQKIFQGVADTLGKVAEKLGVWAEKLGLVTEEMKKNQEIAREDIAINLARRDALVENAKIEAEISEARAKSAEKDKYTAAERLAFLEQAQEGERAILDTNLELARREYENLQAKAELTKNDAAMNQKLAESRANLYKIKKEYYDGVRRLNQQHAAVQKEVEAEILAAREAALNARMAQDELEAKDFVARLEERLALAQGFYAASEQALKDYNARIAAENEEWWAEDNAATEARENAELAAAEKHNAEIKAANKKKLDNFRQTAEGISSILDMVAGAYQNDIKTRVESGKISEEEGEREFERVKALQYATTWINTLSGMTAALASAAGMGPVGWIAGAVQSAAILAAGIANTVKIKNTTLGSTQKSSAVGSGVTAATAVSVNAPQPTLAVPEYRQYTTAEDEERLNQRLASQKVYLVTSELEAQQEARKVQLTESAF